ncbi:hypothetical protein [Larkinella rosea]|uniref:O-antigen ligase domain-containing protein n=1 Tax=Larkinella rosea TaxID=2025312 RepID=A0A3P1BT20_9BACT|nr:hypothetical protein [Larkinella rosea]RRB04251.1 hypothetical protein EHT25_12080 [Larkinella rosea]
MEKVSQKTAWPEYVLVYGLIAVSGIEYSGPYPEFTIGLLAVACLAAIGRKTLFTVRPLLILLLAFLLELFQAVYLNQFAPLSWLPILLKLFVGYLIIHICGLKTIKRYVKIIYVSTLISLPIYFLTFVPAVEQFLIQNVARVFFNPVFSAENGLTSPTMLVYTFNPFAVDQIGSWLIKCNSGPFRNPGLFAVMINLALVLNTIRKKSLINQRNGWLAVGLLTTGSMTGFGTLICIAVGYLFTKQTLGKPLKLMAILLIIPSAGFLIYAQKAFMGDSMQQNMNRTQQEGKSSLDNSYRDWVDLTKSPFVGLGDAAQSRDRSIHRDNGLMALLITYGIPATLLYFSMLFLFFRRLCRYYGFPVSFAGFAFLSVLISGFSQIIFDSPVLLAFLFLAERLRQIQTKPVARQRAHLTPSEA